MAMDPLNTGRFQQILKIEVVTSTTYRKQRLYSHDSVTGDSFVKGGRSTPRECTVGIKVTT